MFNVIAVQANTFYFNYHALIKLIAISCFLFSFGHFLNTQRNFYFNQEVFDINTVPAGQVVWIYPKDKTQVAVMPDSLTYILNAPPGDLNYNVDVWVVGIYTSQNQIVKIEVPDYAIDLFKLRAPTPTAK